MAKKTRPRGKMYTNYVIQGFANTAGQYRANAVLADIKANLEAFASQGEEVKISSAILTLDANSTVPFAVDIAGMVADAAIAAAGYADASPNGILDDDLDIMTAGDYEFQHMITVVSKPIASNYHSCRVRLDITSFVQKVSAMLVRSALLSTNPYACIVGRSFVYTANTAIPCQCKIDLTYSTVAKPLRMLA